MNGLPYSADKCSGGTATASTTNGANTATKAFDDNATTFWESQNPHGATEWIKYNFGAGVVWPISQVSIKPSTAGYIPNAFTVAGSNNDSDWTDLYSGNCANNTNVQTFPFSIPNVVSYRYIRITFTSFYGTQSIGIHEVEMMAGGITGAGLLQTLNFFKNN